MRRFVSTAAISAILLVGGAASSNQGAVMTAVVGDASASGRSLAGQDALGDDEVLEVGEGAGCSILLDQNAVMELCGGTRLSFETDPTRGTRIVNIDSGELRLLVESQKSGARIEVHTPAAIAMILGTIVYVVVDPVTKASTFASLQSQVEILDRENETQGTKTISAREQLTVAPGQAHEKTTLSEKQLAELGGCLLDFRDVALRAARSGLAAGAVDRMLDIDRAAIERGFERPDFELRDLASEGVIDVTDTEEFRREYPGDPMPPPPPDCEIHNPPIPGEHCNF